MVDRKEQLSLVRTQAFQTCDALSNLAYILCDERDVHGIAFCMGKVRELELTIRRLEARFDR